MSGALMTLSPAEIRYTQDSIKNKFRNGRLLSYTFAQLLYSRLSVSSLEDIECVQKDGHWWALSGNRRLYVYKKLQEAGKIVNITVRQRSLALSAVEFAKRLTTKCSGLSITCRGFGTESQMQSIVTRWKNGESFDAVTVGLQGGTDAWTSLVSAGRYNDDSDDDDLGDLFGRSYNYFHDDDDRCGGYYDDFDGYDYYGGNSSDYDYD